MVDRSTVLQVEHLTVRYPVHSGILRRQRAQVHAVEDVSFEIHEGETLGLVGESGSGKSTVAKAIVRLVDPTSGRVIFLGEDITELRGEKMRSRRRHLQMIFQDPFSSLNPRQRIGDTVAAPIRAHRILGDSADIEQRVDELLGLCGLPDDAARRYPYAFSGGQRQRIGIARALGVQPKLIVADEPVSALDVSIQAQIINLLQELQVKTGISYLLIAHNIAVVASIAHRVAIMYLGRIVETGAATQVLTTPQHPYTRALLSAVPLPDVALQRTRQRIVLGGEPPSPLDPPSGCHFHIRCPLATERCRHETPRLEERSGGHLAACWNT